MKILCASDLHGSWDFSDLPEADVAVFAGDITGWGKLEEIHAFNSLLPRIPARTKIVVAGNHDWAFYDAATAKAARALLTNAIYLQDEAVEVSGIKFYGSPWTIRMGSWAFMLPEAGLAEKWELIPVGTEVLVTHCPPAGKCDFTGTMYRGCPHLRSKIELIKPRLHVFGHVHVGRGTAFNADTLFVNAAICSFGNVPIYEPMLISI